MTATTLHKLGWRKTPKGWRSPDTKNVMPERVALVVAKQMARFDRFIAALPQL